MAIFLMRPLYKQDLTIFLFGLLCVCAYGLKVDFSRLRQIRKPYIIDKRGSSECFGNPCPPNQPFLCKSSPTCIALDSVCDQIPDCQDGFDESPHLCNAKNRPSVEMLEEFLDRNRKWIIPKLFDGASPEFVAHSLAVSSDLDELKGMVGISDETGKNLRDAFVGAMEGDERPLMKLGMPDTAWYDTQYVLSKLLQGGFHL
ncbi:hypothetical protein ScPMuIL_014866 [Solemya velum]